MALRVASPLRPAAENPDLHSTTEEEFSGPAGLGLVCDVPIVKTALYDLGSTWPVSLPFADLARRARAALGLSLTLLLADQETEALADALLLGYSRGLVEMHVASFLCAAHAGELPMVNPLARLQIQRGADVVTTLCHRSVRIQDSLTRRLLVFLDGTRDRAALLRDLNELVLAEGMPLEQDGRQVSDPVAIADLLASGLGPSLDQLAKMALLVQ